MGAGISIGLTRLEHGRGLSVPEVATAGSAGADLMAAVPGDDPVTLAPGQRVLVPTGLVLSLPEGHEGQVRPRSGLAAQYGVSVLNAPGTIDADYRGEVKVLLINHGEAPFTVRRGDRIAQLVIAPVTGVRFVEITEPEETARGAGGFGSTGVAAGEGR
jgi:dUTP pyrophosphatase